MPSGLHAEIGVRAAQAGKHVICEKPIDITLDAADRLIAACDEAGVKLQVISQHRFGAGMQRLKKAIDEGALGTLVMGNAEISGIARRHITIAAAGAAPGRSMAAAA